MVAASSCDDGSNRPLASGQSAARQWDEEILGAIRRDNPRPPVHARNLFHVSAAMWDAWAAYDPVAAQYFVDERATSDDVERDRAIAISFAAYRVLFHRYSPGLAIGGQRSQASFDARMDALGLDRDLHLGRGRQPGRARQPHRRRRHRVRARTTAQTRPATMPTRPTSPSTSRWS